jgi:tetratricopeptide (TPR) repeat protein
MHPIRTARRILQITLLCLASALPLHAAPYLPAIGTQVLERLPSRGDPAQRELQHLRAALQATPGDLPLAVELARRYIETARGSGDPRYLGYAQAALSAWWEQAQPPPQVRVLRATIRQSQHDFSAALADLDAVLDADPRNAQAWLTRATILQVQGEPGQARENCARLYRLAPELVTVTCIANAEALGPRAAQAYALLQTSLSRHPDSDAGTRLWAHTLLAEIAARHGDAEAAQAHFRQALALDANDAYLLGAYADFLLGQHRAAEVTSLLAGRTRNDGLLLRYALALKQQRASDAARQIETLRERFDAAALRGDTLHQREQARFELDLLGNPRAALEHARRNWMRQKEFADACILLQAAAANHDREAARPVLTWLRQNGAASPPLQALAAQLEDVHR